MNTFDRMRAELSELMRLVRESASYCTAVAAKPELATTESHAKEIQREHRIADLTRTYGITA